MSSDNVSQEYQVRGPAQRERAEEEGRECIAPRCTYKAERGKGPLGRRRPPLTLVSDGKRDECDDLPREIRSCHAGHGARCCTR